MAPMGSIGVAADVMARVRQAREQADQWAAEEGRVAHLAATSKGASTDGHDGTEEEETEVAELLSRVLTGPHTTPEPGSTPSGTLREGRAYSAAWSSSGGRRGRSRSHSKGRSISPTAGAHRAPWRGTSATPKDVSGHAPVVAREEDAVVLGGRSDSRSETPIIPIATINLFED